MTKATLQYNWRYVWRGQTMWLLTQLVSGVGIGVGFAIGGWAMSWL